MKKTTNPSPLSASLSSSVSSPTNPSAVDLTNNDHGYASQESISRRAYELWQEAGCPDRRETEFWLEAEQQLGDVAAANHAK